MPLRFYQSFDINEKDFEELFCAECSRHGNSVDNLNFCIGCESLFCYECLEDHMRNEGNSEFQETQDVASTGYKHATKASENNNNFNRYRKYRKNLVKPKLLK